MAFRRFSGVRFLRQPELGEAIFYWQGGVLVNASGAPLAEVFVMGRGQQPPLATNARLSPRLGDSLVPERYAPFIPHLPQGSALATSERGLFVALPESTP